jgi:hypothetical protein
MTSTPARRGDRPAFYRDRRPRPQAHSDEALLDCLRAAAADIGEPLTVSGYNAHARDGGGCPTSQTHINRFGSWRQALQAAGLAAHPASGVAGRGRFTAASCAAAVAACAKRLRKTPTALDYQAYAADRPSRPSLSTVRKVCGGWEEALRQAGI